MSLIGQQLSKLLESIEDKAMKKGTFSIMKKIWRMLLQENTPIYTKNLLWANERFTTNLFSYVENMELFRQSLNKGLLEKEHMQSLFKGPNTRIYNLSPGLHVIHFLAAVAKKWKNLE